MTSTKLHPIFCDLVVREDDCNLACSYCLTGQSNFKAGHAEQRIFATPGIGRLSPLDREGRALLDLIERHVQAGAIVLKLSGGEFLMHRGALDLLDAVAPLFEKVVVLTNGSYLNAQRRARLARVPNLVLQVSLDGIGAEASALRTPNPDIHRQIVARVVAAIEQDLVDEIYCVLHDRSLKGLVETHDWLKSFPRPPILLPFPNRGPQTGKDSVWETETGALEVLADRARSGEPALPDPGYFSDLLEAIGMGQRIRRCHLPRVAYSLFDDGKATSCPNIWFDRHDLGDDPAALFKAMETMPFRQLLLAKMPRIRACQGCYTPWDPLSAFFEGRLDGEALAKIPTYSGARTLAALRACREMVLAGAI